MITEFTCDLLCEFLSIHFLILIHSPFSFSLFYILLVLCAYAIIFSISSLLIPLSVLSFSFATFLLLQLFFMIQGFIELGDYQEGCTNYINKNDHTKITLRNRKNIYIKNLRKQSNFNNTNNNSYLKIIFSNK